MTTSIFEFPRAAEIDKVNSPVVVDVVAVGAADGVGEGVGVCDGSTSSTTIDVVSGSDSIALRAN